MQREAIYEVWAPAASVWSLWARPVLFAHLPEATTEPAGEQPWQRFDLRWLSGAGDGVALVVDLNGEESVHMGLALATRGYRPVPLYNACPDRHEVIYQGSIIDALRAGTGHLASQSLPADAPPAFLLDALRTSPLQPMSPGDFDNRWQIFPQDVPSAAFLTARGFKRVVLIRRGRKGPQEDLADVLLLWQAAGIAVEAKNVADESPAAPITLARPAWYVRALRRVQEALGLRRAPRGGFGRIVSEPSHG